MIIYLDFDGVLHQDQVYLDRHNRPFLRGHGQLFEYASRLEQMLAPHSNVQIVLSTSWVRIKGFDYSRKQLPIGLRNRVVGATWHSRFRLDEELLNRWLNRSSRFEQIMDDVKRRRPDHWLALDDDNAGWPEEAASHLIACDPTFGLSEPRVRDLLEQRLKQPLSRIH